MENEKPKMKVVDLIISSMGEDPHSLKEIQVLVNQKHNKNISINAVSGHISIHMNRFERITPGVYKVKEGSTIVAKTQRVNQGTNISMLMSILKNGPMRLSQIREEARKQYNDDSWVTYTVRYKNLITTSGPDKRKVYSLTPIGKEKVKVLETSLNGTLPTVIPTKTIKSYKRKELIAEERMSFNISVNMNALGALLKSMKFEI